MFDLILTNGSEDLTLSFALKDTAIAQKWYNELKQNYPLYETERFTNWGSHNLIEQLNNCIDEINKYDSVIDFKVSEFTTQADLNYLHKFFEDLRGSIEEESDWFTKAPTNIKDSVQLLNILIHNLESEIRTRNHPTVVVTFRDRPTYELDRNDIKNFTFRWTSGTVYINYCHVGKPVLDVFKDKDKIAERIYPQTHYSADFMVKFGPTTPYLLYCLRKIVINIWLKFQKFKFKNYNIGMIPVADLVSDISQTNLKKFKKVKGIRVYE